MSDLDNDSQQTLKLLCTLVENLSVHQRQLSAKIEELHLHHEQIYAQQNTVYSQIDALFSIFSLITIRHPLPTMRGWPVSPDFVKVLMSVILEKKPAVILELGSGVSTLIGSYSLEKKKKGTLISLDHDPEFAALTRKNLMLHGLASYADVVCCPLKEQNLFGETHLWYDIDKNRLPLAIDILVVDGPPSSYKNTIRYPALPFFFERLSDRAIVVLDDAARPGEKEIVSQWMASYDCFDHDYLDTEKGAVILRKKGKNHDTSESC
jgi:predicted O-methyltransferase YrrM